ncbi:MAG: glycosyltransferase [Candidatus Hydrogenedentes bacterium]|nr:glycosyltransferase [Candidatus Hydrogenedentota bacterium]
MLNKPGAENPPSDDEAGFDARRVGVNLVRLPVHNGNERLYLRRLLDTMRRLQPELQFILFTDAASHDLFTDWTRVPVQMDDKKGWLGLSGKASPWDRLPEDHNLDRLFTPLETAPQKCSVPVIAYALDLSILANGTVQTERPAPQLKDLRKIAQQITALVTPSEFSRRAFLERLGLTVEKIFVAPVGVDKGLDTDQPPTVAEPYMIIMGGTAETSNLLQLFQAFERMREELPRVLVALSGFSETDFGEWNRQVLRIDELPLQQRAALYQHSEFAICPSVCDGAGMAMLEAMQAGARVVAARAGGLPEVGGDVPFFFDPESVTGIISAVRRAIEEGPGARESRVRNGRRRASEYTWEKCAWKTLQVLGRQ